MTPPLPALPWPRSEELPDRAAIPPHAASGPGAPRGSGDIAPPPDIELACALIYDRDARGRWGEHARSVVVLRRRTLRDHTEHEALVRVEGESEPRWIHAERLGAEAT